MLGKKDFLYDKRLVERYLKSGDLTHEAYKQHIDNLADVADKGEHLTPLEELELEHQMVSRTETQASRLSEPEPTPALDEPIE